MSDDRLALLEKELSAIKARNLRVEADKAWEVSGLRISTICAITYIVAALLLYILGNERFWLNALVPVFGFYLSSQSLPFAKKYWIEHAYRASHTAKDKE